MEVLGGKAPWAGALGICSGAPADSPLSERYTHAQLCKERRWSHPRTTSPLARRVTHGVQTLTATCLRQGCIGGESARRPLVFPLLTLPTPAVYLLGEERRQRRERPGGAPVWSSFGYLTGQGSSRPRVGETSERGPDGWEQSLANVRQGWGGECGDRPREGQRTPPGVRFRPEGPGRAELPPGHCRSGAARPSRAPPPPRGGGRPGSDSCQGRGRRFASPPPPRLPQAGPKSRRSAYRCYRRAARPRCPRCPHQR